LIKPPRLIAWEMTKACNLACRHCRASAITQLDSNELSTVEAKGFIDHLADYGRPILILTGGEPLLRKDVYEIARYGTDKGLKVVLATNGTLVTPEIAQHLKWAGIQRISVSIDGSDAATHDDFRGESGSFDASLRALTYIEDAGIGYQINTIITKRNIEQIPGILDLAIKLGTDALHIFLLVPTGRGKEMMDDEIPPEEYEQVLNWFYKQQKTVPIQLKATCAPHYFRIMRQHAKKEGIKITPETHGFEAMTRGCLAGSGFCFVSHIGDVNPCGYLPVLAGNIKQQSFCDIWENSKIFIDLRDVKKLKGKCGICEYREVCGGCRARAYAKTGDYMDEEPYCIYTPRRG
jgi:heme b synthase